MVGGGDGGCRVGWGWVEGWLGGKLRVDGRGDLRVYIGGNMNEDLVKNENFGPDEAEMCL